MRPRARRVKKIPVLVREKVEEGPPDWETISMIVEKFAEGQEEQFSASHRIHGYPWRLRVFKDEKVKEENKYKVDLICEKSNESELWKCTPKAVGFKRFNYVHMPKFNSWKVGHFVLCETVEEGELVQVTIGKAEEDGKSWTLLPTLHIFAPRDGVLLIGEENKKIHVNKKFLASQSPYFDRLFFGDFKEKNMSEIPIGDVKYEEFSILIAILYRRERVPLTVKNMRKILQLADRFETKVVEDRVVNFVLSASSLSICKKLLFSEQYNLPFIKDVILSRYYSPREYSDISHARELKKLSKDTVIALFRDASYHLDTLADMSSSCNSDSSDDGWGHTRDW